MNAEQIREHIRSDAVNKNINIGNQTKHIPGSHNFDPTRSEIFGDLYSVQNLVNQHYGTGRIGFTNNGDWNHKETITSNKPIGIYRNKQGDEYETNKFTIHYGIKGAHIVPARRKKK